MQHPILDKIAKEKATVIALVEPLDDAQLDKQYQGGWTIREILTHLWLTEEDHCRVIATIVKGNNERLMQPDFDLDAHNATRLQERGVLSKAEILAGWDAQRERTEGLFNRYNEEQLAMEGSHPALGTMAVSKIFRIIGIHTKLHMLEIKETIG